MRCFLLCFIMQTSPSGATIVKLWYEYEKHFLFLSFQTFNFAKTIRGVEISLYRQISHTFVQSVQNTHTDIIYIYIYKTGMSSTTINYKTIYQETIKYFRIYNIVSKEVFKNSIFFEILTHSQMRAARHLY